jgi:hypothetical protein
MTVKLTQTERKAIAKTTRTAMRQAGYEAADATIIDAAAGEIEQHVEALGRFDALPYAEISDYAWSFARQLYPIAARDC